MKKSLAVLGIVIFLLFPILFLGSCSSPNKKSQPDQTENLHKVDTVTIQLMKFTPGELTVNPGDTVIWINKGLVSHTVKSYQDNKFYSDTLNPGKTWTLVVKDSAAYYCSIHPTMQGKLVLK
ncbi:MAG: plastocyanin/azurin family copper-binding protein [Ginsengibacter sp.]